MHRTATLPPHGTLADELPMLLLEQHLLGLAGMSKKVPLALVCRRSAVVQSHSVSYSIASLIPSFQICCLP